MIVRKLNTHLTKYISCVFFFFALITFCNTTVAYAQPLVSRNQETGYTYVLDDQADFFSDANESSLEQLMEEITAYCNVAVVTTTSHSSYSTEDFAADYYDDVFGPHESGTIFVIDRCLNEIYLYSDGQAHKTITNSRAYSITDNTYHYATADGGRDYYTCSYKTLEQVKTLLEGRKIAEPMKYICSALLALILALLLNYVIAMSLSRSRKTDIRQVLDGTYTSTNVKNANARFMNQTRVYSPPSSSSSGGGHSGGGGGHSGGGGGHSI